MGSLSEMLFSAEGRIGRRDYWIWSILVNLLALALQHYVFGRWTAIPAFLDALFYDDPWRPDETTVLYGVLAALTLWPIVCLNAKRWHDRGKSGFIAGIVMALGLACYALRWLYGDAQIYGDPYGYSSDFYVLMRVVPTLYTIFLVWTFIECGLMPGQPRTNRYGPPCGGYRYYEYEREA